jgi:hypothetical protein
MEALESRLVPTVTVDPHKISLHSINSKNDTLEVKIVGDTPDALSLINGGVPLVVTVTDSTGNSAVVTSVAFKHIHFHTHHGVPSIEWEFRRNFLQSTANGVPLAPGTATVDVSDTANPESAGTGTTGTTTTGTTTTTANANANANTGTATFESTTLEIRS